MKSKLVALIVLLGTVTTAQAEFYAETGAGIANDSPAFSVRVGNHRESWDFSLGYLNLLNRKPDALLSDGADLPTVNVEVYRLLPVAGESFRAALGGGLGYTMPNLGSGINEQADNGLSYTLGGYVTMPLNNAVDLRFSAKGFFFNAGTRWRKESSHTETVMQNGIPIGTVEVTDEILGSNSVNFNAAVAMVSILWK